MGYGKTDELAINTIRLLAVCSDFIALSDSSKEHL